MEPVEEERRKIGDLGGMTDHVAVDTADTAKGTKRSKCNNTVDGGSLADYIGVNDGNENQKYKGIDGKAIKKEEMEDSK